MAVRLIPAAEPESFIAGDSVEWSLSLPDYLPTVWTASVVFVNASKQFGARGYDYGDGTHRLRLEPAITALIPAGVYAWQRYVSTATDRLCIAQGSTRVSPNFATQSSGIDMRTHARRVLDAIEAVLENRASEDDSYVMIGATQITKLPHADLLALRSQYRREVANETSAERIALGLDSGRTVRVRM